jgi:putative ABC transport system permease protein
MSIASLLLMIRFRFRGLLRAPWRTASRIVLLSAAAGPSIALVLVAAGIARDPLPFADSGSLAVVAALRDGGTTPSYNLTYGDIDRLRASPQIARVAAVQLGERAGRADLFDFRGPEYTVRLTGARVSPAFFEIVGASAARGRVFTDASYAGGEDRAIVLSDRLWRQRFGASDDAVGSLVTLGGVAYSVTGVMAPEFVGTDREPVDVWMAWAPGGKEIRTRAEVCCTAVARMQPGVHFDAAGPALSQGATGKRYIPMPIREHLARQSIDAIALLSATAGLVVLLALVALVHGHMSYAAGASSELAVLSACGVPPRQLWSMLVAEDILLTVAAWPFIVASAAGAMTLVARLAPGVAAAGSTVGVVMLPALAGGCLLSMIASAAGTLVVTRRFARARSVTSLMKPQVSANSRARQVASLAIASTLTVVLVVASVVGASALRLSEERLGFDSSGVTMIDMRLSFERFKAPADVTLFEERAVNALRSVPGVVSAWRSDGVPIAAPGRTRALSNPLSGGRVNLTQYRADPAYFTELRIPLLEGRMFDSGDSGPVALVSKECAATLYGGRALGQMLDLAKPTKIIGVVGNVASRAGNWDHCSVFVPAAQDQTWSVRLLIRTAPGSRVNEEALRGAIALVDPAQPVSRFVDLPAVIGAALAPRRLTAAAVIALTVVAWLVGISWFQGALIKTLAEKRAEMGLRLAIGGTPARVAGAILGNEVRPLALGVLLGLAASVPVSRLTRHLVFQLSAPDVQAIAMTATLGIGTILALCAITVIRMTRREPRTLLY